MKNTPYTIKENGKMVGNNGFALNKDFINEYDNRRERRKHLHNSSGSMKSKMMILGHSRIKFRYQNILDKKTGHVKVIKHAEAV
jgi:hypothetical protein